MASLKLARGEPVIQNNLTRDVGKLDPADDRNLDNFTTITGVHDRKVYDGRLASFKVAVTVQDGKDEVQRSNQMLTCAVLLNMLNRFLRYINYNGDITSLMKFLLPAIPPPPSLLQEFKSKKFEGSPDLTIVIGQEETKEGNPIYVASSGWSIFISRRVPCDWKIHARNPLSAIYLAGLVAGEVFKELVKDFVHVEIVKTFQYDFITHGKTMQPVIEPQIPDTLELNLALIGCGGVGQAIVYALSQFDLRGEISLIDPDRIDPTNVQRYPLAFKEFLGKLKTTFLSQFLLDRRNPLLTTREYSVPYEVAITIQESLFSMKEVLVSVDNRRTRINIQAALPKVIWNAWTDTGNSYLRYGIGKHVFSSGFQCLACAYFPKGAPPDQMEINAALLGLSVDDVKRKMDANDLITDADIQRVMNNFTVPPDHIGKLKSIIGQPFSHFFHGECGVFNARLFEKHEPTPATHVPTLLGTYLVIQYILDKMDLKDASLVESVAEFDAFSYPTKDCLIKKLQEPGCVCNDEIYQTAYKKKWHPEN